MKGFSTDPQPSRVVLDEFLNWLAFVKSMCKFRGYPVVRKFYVGNARFHVSFSKLPWLSLPKYLWSTSFHEYPSKLRQHGLVSQRDGIWQRRQSSSAVFPSIRLTLHATVLCILSSSLLFALPLRLSVPGKIWLLISRDVVLDLAMLLALRCLLRCSPFGFRLLGLFVASAGRGRKASLGKGGGREEFR
eukprot:CAMPEP_0197712528 /NCGR_PEP_ID=MMETSP1338-20131121/130002_1 /TAXON_ID=43686 ORGANISM="Pelagodinium beii, Strain RCC1491" /NCGR_SAMPLE_ID=MMETSP1338 /ASSEMBLY_ACC=CAM_ASM_000754 /LENGTH=188 /DNA_ID=CAMNT_0043296465 /DNA_START=1144 /DNA_END=1711 /DNA_ORIENTATION=-